jgi:predicted nucleic acid-binding protein
LLDTNVVVAAIKHPRRETDTLKLLTKIIQDQGVRLVADELLLEEMIRYAELLKSPTTTAIIAALARKTSVVKVSKRYRSICKTYVKTPDKGDILHAAACLQREAVLITNDRHFKRIAKEGIIEIWSITDAIRNLL